MALSILDGTQTATTLSTILSSGQHITAHTVVSLGTQAITDIVNATSAGLTNTQLRASAITIGGTVTANLTINAFTNTQAGIASDDGGGEPNLGIQLGYYDGDYKTVKPSQPLPISGTVTIGAGTAQIGSVTASISGTVPVSISSVTVGNSVTIGSLPAISGTVTANGGDGTFLVGGLRSGGKTALQLDAGTGYLQTKVESLPSLVAGTAQIGSVTASISNSLTISSLPAISGTVTASVSNFSSIASDGGGNAPPNGIQLGFSAGEEDYRIVDPSNPLPVTASGTVTANSSNGSLTTRFGSVTTANTAFATSAVTNTNRKYLLIQNITTASNVITVGIGFTPTTTQGIQLFAGAGLTFEGSYIPTGAVNLLSSVTASCYTILEA